MATSDKLSINQPQDDTKSKKCFQCGNEVPMAASVCPFCEQQLKCPNPQCGMELKAGYKVCPGCGRKLRKWHRRIFEDVMEESGPKIASRIIISTIGALVPPVVGWLTWNKVGLISGCVVGAVVGIFIFRYIEALARMALMLVYGLLGGVFGGALLGGIGWFVSSPLLGSIFGYAAGDVIAKILTAVVLGFTVVVVEEFIERQIFLKKASRVILGVAIGVVGWVVALIVTPGVHEVILDRMNLSEVSGWAVSWAVGWAVAGAFAGAVFSLLVGMQSERK